MKTTKSKIRCGGMSAILVVAVGLMVFQARVSKAAPMGTAFKYQGRLIDSNDAADGEYDFEFKLFDANVAGTQQGSAVNLNEVDVIDGYFTVELDFGDVFTGEARWLEIGIRPGDLNDPNVHTILSPRQEVTPVPYALQTRGIFVDSAGNVGIGTTTPNTLLHVKAPSWNTLTVEASSNDPVLQLTSDGTSINNDWTMRMDVSGSDKLQFRYDNSAKLTMTTTGNVGIGTTAPAYPLHVVSAGSRTINAHNTATSGAADGVWGQTDSTDGWGVSGLATATSGPTIGVRGHSNSTSGMGVFGRATASSGAAIGVRGRSDSTSGTGVVGQATASSGTTDGVRGRSDSTSGRGVYGYATNTGNVTNYGGRFEAAGSTGRGVYGEASNTGIVYNYGGFFTAAGGNGRGVYGKATGTSGQGVHGVAAGGNGIGVYSYAPGSFGIGVYGWGQQFDFYAGGPGTNYGVASSIRWKNDIRAIDDPLGKILRLRGVYFNWDTEHGGHHDVGMIAEEVGEVLPEIVEYEENGTDATGMDYSMLTPLLVEAVKALKIEVNELQRQNAEKDGVIDTLKQQNDKLEGRLAALESSITTITVQLKGGRK